MSLQRFRASRSIPPLARHPLTAVGGQPLQTHPAELPQTVIPASVVSIRWLQGGIGSRKISEDAADLKLLNRKHATTTSRLNICVRRGWPPAAVSGCRASGGMKRSGTSENAYIQEQYEQT